ncbi:hypothetical protein DSO57_1018345 [Entomophthora muscae]|uniref:Uncharacterized protein n=1 Tax=Entomophthora muscae TaxID=34485 RepID=A0ACC2TRN7_9FUNG|nr:hypothetical protein DSO57_1018345 [Entomophthora muscae]
MKEKPLLASSGGVRNITETYSCVTNAQTPAVTKQIHTATTQKPAANTQTPTAIEKMPTTLASPSC